MYYFPILLKISKESVNLTIQFYLPTVCLVGLISKEFSVRSLALCQILTYTTRKSTHNVNFWHLPSVVVTGFEVPARVVVSKADVVAVDTTPVTIIIIITFQESKISGCFSKGNVTMS